MLARVRVGEDRRAGGMQPFVPIGVVEMPMRVDQMLDRIVAEGGERLGNLGSSAGNPSVHQQLSIGPRQNRDVPTGSHEHADVPAKRLHVNLRRLSGLANLRDEVIALVSRVRTRGPERQ